MRQLPEFIMLSAELSHLNNEVNQNRTIKLFNMLNDLGIEFRPIEGVYKGTSEISFMVIVKNESEIEAIRDLGLKTFGQESILFRDLHGKAYLEYFNGNKEYLGKFKQVDNVENLDAYSIIGGKFYAVS